MPRSAAFSNARAVAGDVAHGICEHADAKSQSSTGNHVTWL